MERLKYGRPVLAEGIEHTVLASKSKTGILKIPRTFNRLSFWPFNPVSTVTKELKEARALVEGTGVKIPRTNICKAKFNCFNFIMPGYIMRQEIIDGDGSIADIRKYLEKEGLETLAHEFDHEPRNFVPHDGFVYWVDPTKGPAGRILERFDIEIESWRKARAICSKPIRLLGL